MSLRILDFDRLDLDNSIGDLNLSVASSATFLLPSQTLSLIGEQSFAEALTNMLWVSRGNLCRLDICFSYNGNEFSLESWRHGIETLGTYIRDSSLWKQLSLSASLEVLHSGKGDALHPQISLRIRPQDDHLPNQPVQPWPRSLRSDGIEVPPSVPSAELRSLRLYLQFSTTSATIPPAPKRMRIRSEESNGERSVPMWESRSLTKPDAEKGSIWDFEELIQIPEDEMLIASGLLDSGLSHPGIKVKLLEPLFPDLPFREAVVGPSADDAEIFPPGSTYRSHTWIGSSKDHEQLIFCEDASFQSVTDDEDDMLFSQATTTLTTPYSAAASTVSSTTTNSSLITLKRSSPAFTESTSPLPPPSLTSQPTLTLISLAIQLLLVGHHPRSLRGKPNLTIATRPPTSPTSLSSLAPSIFSPGHYKLMQTNAQFLATLSHSISFIWPKNAQSPSLRRKLRDLAGIKPINSNDEVHVDNKEIAEEHSFEQRLSDVVQSRLWAMMQRRLYDPSAARKLHVDILPPSGYTPERRDESDRFDDLLRNQYRPSDELDIYTAGTLPDYDMIRADSDSDADADQGDDFKDIFNDEVSADEDGLLHYFEQEAGDHREKWEVERETDEMLFRLGDEGDVGEGVMFLGLDGYHDDDEGLLI